MKNKKMAFIGAGNMTRALLAGLISDGYSSDNIVVSNPSVEKLDFLQKQYGIRVETDNQKAAQQAEVIVLSVKPQRVREVCEQLRNTVMATRPLLISIAVGARDTILQKWLGGYNNIIRAMPNTPAMVGAGATVLYPNPKVNKGDKSIAEALFRSVGLTFWVDDEIVLDRAIAVSGSGPAYLFLVIEAMQKAAKTLGLPADMLELLITQTVLGSARMALETDQHVTQLRQSVTSPKGTTERAIAVFEDHGFSDLFLKAMQAAYMRAEELSDLLEKE